MKKFDILFESIISQVNSKVYKDFIDDYPYGEEHALIFTKKLIKKRATQAKEAGTLKTRESKGNAVYVYETGDYIAQDSKGGKYVIKQADFDKLYDPSGEEGVYFSKPVDIKMFKTDKEITIHTEWGDLTSSPNDWIEIKADGSFGAPRKPDVILTDYKLAENKE